jgi:hypothetical protein
MVMRAFGGAVGYPMYPTRKALPGVFTPNDHWQMVAEDRAPTVRDSSYSSVEFLIHGNAVLNTGQPIDSGPLATSPGYIAFTAGSVDSAQVGPFAFGGTSFKSTATRCGFSVGFPSNVTMGTSDFTLEGWFYFPVISTTQVLFDGRPTSTNGLYPTIFLDATASKFIYFTNSANKITSTTAAVANTPYHVAYTRSGGNLGTLWLNGVSQGTWVDSTSYVAMSRMLISQAAFGTGTGITVNGFYDEMRFTPGVARYTSGFTPPTQRFPDY